ncbi:unnamed protein product [Gongylonema pulchrum]|uniref:Secreted protein n=1 Tax=Gongylonema pulchrum TaxID=637853 RepID=A0A183ELV5_9BILA|nr:unnamed protein product [Gongylonema pulchrum]
MIVWLQKQRTVLRHRVATKPRKRQPAKRVRRRPIATPDIQCLRQRKRITSTARTAKHRPKNVGNHHHQQHSTVGKFFQNDVSLGCSGSAIFMHFLHLCNAENVY